MFGDYLDFYRYGLALRSGEYIAPYPLPAVWGLALVSLAPPLVGLIGLSLLSVVILVYLFRREALLWLWYIPILETFAQGQLSMLWLWLLQRGSAWGYALLTLKPHLFPLALPALAARRDLWRPFALWCVALYAPAFVLRPAWLSEWTARVFSGHDGRITAGTTSSLWSVPILALAVAIVLIVARRVEWRTIFTAYNPIIRAYDYTLIAGMSCWLIPLSWGAFGLTQMTQAAWPMALVGVGTAGLMHKASSATGPRVWGYVATFQERR